MGSKYIRRAFWLGLRLFAPDIYSEVISLKEARKRVRQRLQQQVSRPLEDAEANRAYQRLTILLNQTRDARPATKRVTHA